ncbi:hypothetical protein J6590_063860 [Homalodisca vitripennis]|nr:hypothetical protein J6590_063860 [Homalodisca vitripennis]
MQGAFFKILALVVDIVRGLAKGSRALSSLSHPLRRRNRTSKYIFRRPTATSGLLPYSYQDQINFGDYKRNAVWCPDITNLGAVPNLQVDDRYTKPRWSERLSYWGRGHPQHPTYRVLHLLLNPRTEMGISVTEDKRSGKTAVNCPSTHPCQKDTPRTHPQGSSLWTQGFKWGYQLRRIKEAEKQL